MITDVKTVSWEKKRKRDLEKEAIKATAHIGQ